MAEYKTPLHYRTNAVGEFVQPVLVANGTMGGDAFACASSAGTAWQAFNGVASNYCNALNAGGWLSWYNPIDLAVTAIEWTASSAGCMQRAGSVQYSDDNLVWYTACTWDNSASANPMAVAVPGVGAHLYWRLYFTTKGSSGSNSDVSTVTISASTQDRRVGEIPLFEEPDDENNTVGVGVPVKMDGRTLYAAYADADSQYASDLRCLVDGQEKRLLLSQCPTGSVSVTVWNFSAANYSSKAYTLTVPNGVKVLKITGTGFDGWSDDATDYAYLGKISASGTMSGNAATLVYGNGAFTVYLGVTQGASVTLHGRWIRSAEIAWSKDINKQRTNMKY